MSSESSSVKSGSSSSSSSSSSDSNQYWTTNRIFAAVAAGIFISAIIGGILYAIISNSTSEKSEEIPKDENSTSQSANEPTSKTAQPSTSSPDKTAQASSSPGKTPQASTSPDKTPQASALPAISYVKESGSYWDAGESKSYTCPSAVGVNTSGDAGNFANYCIFTGANAKANAEKQCSLDSKCLGYVFGKTPDGAVKVQLTSRGVESISRNYSPDEFYVKTPATAKMYKVKAGSNWDSATTRYKCPSAVGVNTSGDNGNFADYCIFTGANAQGNAEKQCTADSKCLGYSVGKLADGNPKVQLTISGPVASGGNNKYFQKM